MSDVHVWESIDNETRRLSVPGGWLYQIEIRDVASRVDGRSSTIVRWSEPVFVRNPVLPLGIQL